MSGVNKAIIVGRLGQDPETRSLPSGKSVTNMRIATSEKFKTQSGELKETTEWHSVVVFGNLADIAAEYLSKGSMVYVEGKIQTRKWQDKQGNDRYSTEIVGQQLQFLSPKPQGNGTGTGGTGGTAAAKPAKPAPKPAPDFSEDEGADDVLPF